MLAPTKAFIFLGDFPASHVWFPEGITMFWSTNFTESTWTKQASKASWDLAQYILLEAFRWGSWFGCDWRWVHQMAGFKRENEILIQLELGMPIFSDTNLKIRSCWLEQILVDSVWSCILVVDCFSTYLFCPHLVFTCSTRLKATLDFYWPLSCDKLEDKHFNSHQEFWVWLSKWISQGSSIENPPMAMNISKIYHWMRRGALFFGPISVIFCDYLSKTHTIWLFNIAMV